MQRNRLYRGLINYTTAIHDTSLKSLDYFNFDSIPSELNSGKNALWIYGTDKLESKSPILIEILDANQQPLYHEVTSIVDNINRRLISVWVQSNNVRGIGSICAIAELKSQYVPAEWVGKYNIKWSIPIFIDPFKVNVEDIIFNNPPRIYISGFKTTSKEVSPVNFIFNSQYRCASSSKIQYAINGNIDYHSDIESTTIKSQRFGDSSVWSQLSATDYDSGVTLMNSNVDTRQLSTDIIYGERVSVPSSPYRIEASQSIFVSNMIGGILNVFDPINATPVIPSPYQTSSNYPSHYTTRILDVIDNRTLVVDNPYTIKITSAGDYQNHHYSKFDYSNYQITYSYSNDDIQYLTSSIIPKLTIDVQFADVDLAAGDVSRIKIFGRRRNLDSEYKLLHDGSVSINEFLIDPYYPNQTTFFNVDTNKRHYGIFRSPGDAKLYWHTESIGSGSIYRTASIDPQTVIDSIKLYPWTSSSIAEGVDYHTIFHPLATNTYIEKATMSLTCKLMGTYDSESMTYPSLEIYMSGSAFNHIRPPYPVFTDHVNYGKFIGRVKTDSISRNYGLIKFDYTVDRDGTGIPVFKVIGGQWNISNVSIKPAEERGFTPDNFAFNIDIPYDISSSIDLRFEYYDATGRQSKFISYLNNVLLKTVNVGKQYYDEGQLPITRTPLFQSPQFTTASYASLHEFNLNRNVQTISGVVEAIRKSDIFTQQSYINLLATRSSSKYEIADFDPIPPTA